MSLHLQLDVTFGPLDKDGHRTIELHSLRIQLPEELEKDTTHWGMDKSVQKEEGKEKEMGKGKGKGRGKGQNKPFSLIFNGGASLPLILPFRRLVSFYLFLFL